MTSPDLPGVCEPHWKWISLLLSSSQMTTALTQHLDSLCMSDLRGRTIQQSHS